MMPGLETTGTAVVMACYLLRSASNIECHEVQEFEGSITTEQTEGCRWKKERCQMFRDQKALLISLPDKDPDRQCTRSRCS